MRLNDRPLHAGNLRVAADKHRIERQVKLPGGIVGDVDQLMRIRPPPVARSGASAVHDLIVQRDVAQLTVVPEHSYWKLAC